MGSSVSLVALLGRLIVAMAVVIGLMVVAARLLKARGIGGVAPAKGQTSVPIEVVARRGAGVTGRAAQGQRQARHGSGRECSGR